MSHQLRNEDQQQTILRPAFDEAPKQQPSRDHSSSESGVFDVNKALGNLRADPWSMLSEISDIILVVDPNGLVVRAMCHQNLPFGDVVTSWQGVRLEETLTPESREKLDAKLAKLPNAADQRASGADAAMLSNVGHIELNHVSGASNQEYPVQYSLHFLEHNQGFALFGRDLSILSAIQKQLVHAHLSLEQEREQQEQLLAKQHLILESLERPAFFVDAASGDILDHNQRLAGMLNLNTTTKNNSNINKFWTGQDGKKALLELVQAAEDQGSGHATLLAKADEQKLSAEVNIFRTAGKRTLFVKLNETDLVPGQETEDPNIHPFMDQLPEGVAFFDHDGVIKSANEAFLDLTGIGHDITKSELSLARIFTRGQVELNILLDQATKSGVVSSFSTSIRTGYGAQRDVIISIVPLSLKKKGLLGLLMRSNDLSSQNTLPTLPAYQEVSEDEMQTMVNLVGNMPLKEIVAKSADVIEKVCIEAALKMTNNNRMAASELLGLSRQSLYVKLRKFGLLNQEV